MKYYLYIEGVNLANFIYDTNDLSTVRGGSFLLLDAAKIVETHITSPTLEPISTGASQGLFQFYVLDTDAPDADHRAARAVCKEVRRLLSTHDELKHATFVADIQPDTGNYTADREALRARIRWQQLQQPTLAIPTWNEKPVAACEVDRLRPGVDQRPGPENQTECVSVSVQTRSAYGRDYKQQFYRRETGRENLAEVEFARDFKELTSTDKREFRQLHQKMAVIYLDGNGFGRLRDLTCTDADLQRRFDQTMTTYRREALAALLDTVAQDEAWLTDSTYRYRLETLLWGGDELLWVVPAWRGWQALTVFYEQSQSWTWQESPLRHAGGMVFCHHNAPIQRIKSLAVRLSDLAKEKDRQQNLFAYSVLESFDHIGQSLKVSLTKRYGATDVFVIDATQMGEIETHLAALKHTFPRRKLHAIAMGLRETPEASEEALENVVNDLDSKGRNAWGALTACFEGDTHALCYNLLELWDYISIRG